MATKATKPATRSKLEREYEEIFVPHNLPYQGIYTDRDSLEQPSALEVVPTTASPATATVPVTMNPHAKLERDI
jgi:TorA maturation chaperone TorD